MKKLLFLSIAIACLITCSNQPKEPSMKEVVEGALKFSEQQSLLMAQSLADQDTLVPRSFEKGKLLTSTSRWWCSGFYPGVLWYLYENNQSPELLKYAKQYTARIEREKYTTNNHDVGFMLYCSFGNGLRLTGDTSYVEVLLTGAESLSTRYREHIGLIRSWDHNRNKWQYPVIIDNMMNLELLMLASKTSGNPNYADISVKHSDRTMKEHYRPDFSCFHVVSYDTITGNPHAKNTHQGYAHESAWARGQCWGLYGYVLMYRETKEQRYLDMANNIAGFMINHKNMPEDMIPYWDFDAPDIPNAPRDASSGSIMASALLELSGYVDKALSDKYIAVAEKQIRSLSSPAYTAKLGENGNFILEHSTGHLPGNSEVNVPLTYADYYYVEALVRYKKMFLQK